MAKTVNMHEAKTHLSRLVHDIAAGTEREIIIAVSGQPRARLVPFDAPAVRQLGLDRESVIIHADFDDVDAEIEQLFNGRS